MNYRTNYIHRYIYIYCISTMRCARPSKEKRLCGRPPSSVKPMLHLPQITAHEVSANVLLSNLAVRGDEKIFNLDVY